MDLAWGQLAADLVRENRHKAGLTQRALAQRAGVAQTEVARIESGKVQPSLVHLGRLLDAIGVEVDVDVRLVDHRLSAVDAARTISDELARGSEARAFRSALVLADDLHSVTPARLVELVEEAPPTVGDDRYDALLAAVVDDAVSSLGVPAPAWTAEPWRSTQGWLVSGMDELRQVALTESPSAYRRHGVLVVAEDLSRA